jgi:hypothetical protein
MAKNNFQVDGVGINKEHYSGWKEADFIKDILPTVPDRFGDENKKKVWAKKAFDLMQPKTEAKADPVK